MLRFPFAESGAFTHHTVKTVHAKDVPVRGEQQLDF